MNCPEVEVLQCRAWEADVRAHVGSCGSCRLVMELIDERSQAAASAERRVECARFEALIAVRVGAELQGAAASLLDEHLRDCTDCRALANTMAPVEDVAGDHAALPPIDSKAYALGSEVARGGMGRIIAARDLRIGRPVAVKELLSKNAALAARFEREARVTARLQHPGIVPIYEIGRWENGTPFYAMRMVAGKTLRSALLERETLVQRLALLPSVLAACEAVAFAHANQVIHRDLTPSNILVGEYGDTVVIDWGLAKDLSSETADDADAGPYRREPNASADLTAAGAIIGTASYMPPEQAAGDRVDARADVYALGAIHYHLLAGKAPYKGTLDDVLRSVKSEPPAPLPAATPRDLASIVAKAMSRDPAERYPSAKELAAELAAFQAGRLVGAHEYSRGELVRRFVRRNRGVLAATGIAAVVLGALAVFGIRRIIEERDVADQQRTIAETRQSESEALSRTLLVEQGRQELLAGHADRAAAVLIDVYKTDSNNAVVKFLLGAAMRALESQELILGAGGEQAKYLEVSSEGTLLGGNGSGVWVAKTGGARKLLGRGGIGGNGGGLPHFSADGRLVTSPDRSTVRVWSLDGTLDKTLVADRTVGWSGFSRDGKQLFAITDDGGWMMWNTATWQRVRDVPRATPAANAQHANGRPTPIVDDLLAIATVDGRVDVWDWRANTRVSAIDHGARFAFDFASAFDGEHVVTCGIDGKIKRWNARTGALELAIVEPTGPVMSCALGPDLRIVSSSAAGSLRIWSPGGAAAMTVQSEPGVVRFAARGRRLVMITFSGANVRDSATGSMVLELGPVSGFIPVDGDAIYVPRSDGSIQRVGLGQVGIVREHVAVASQRREAISREARIMLVRDSDDRISALDIASGHTTALPISAPAGISPDGTLAVGWREGAIAIVKTSGELVRSFPADRAPYRYAISADNRRLLTRSPGVSTSRVTMWNLETGTAIDTIDDDHQVLDFDPAGRAVLLTQTGALHVWNPPMPPRLVTSRALFLSASHDGRYLAVADGWLGIEVFDMETLASKLFVPGDSAGTFDQSGHFYSHDRHVVVVYDLATFTEIRRFQIAESTTANQIAASPNGSLLATSAGVFSVADGHMLAAFDRGTPSVRIPERDLEFGLDSVAFSRSGDELIIETASGLRVWDMRPESRTSTTLEPTVRRHIGWRLDAGRLVPTSASETATHDIAMLRGRVLHRGVGVANARISVVEERTVRPLGVSGPDGTFAVRAMPGRQLLNIWSKERGVFGEAEMGEDTPIDIELDFEASIAGRIVDSQGRPKPRVHVTAQITTKNDDGNDITDADGRFTIRALRGGGDYNLVLRDLDKGWPVIPPHSPTITVASKQTHVEGVEVVVPVDQPVGRELDPRVYHRLTTRWQSRARSLDVDGGGDNSELMFAPTWFFSGQFWKLAPAGTAFRLSTVFQGDSKRLGAIGDHPQLIADGAQTWVLERRDDGSYRLQLSGTRQCLSGGLTIIIAACDDSSEQRWLVTPTSANVE
jgi:eukaryotic-like serine/threonine-protein kinase